MVIVIKLSSLIAAAQAVPMAPAATEPLWLKLLSGAVIAALITGFFKLWELHQQLKGVGEEIRLKLQADVTKLDIEIEARLRAEARTEAAQLRQTYVNALPYHSTLLRDQMLALREKLADHKSRHEMAEWFLQIKQYGARQLFKDGDEKEPVSPEEFSARCHYLYIFAMSTVYYTSVFLFFSQRILSLAPFSEVDSALSNRLDQCLKDVGYAFARRNARGNAEQVKAEVRDNGLWETVQNNMGAIVTKDQWYLSYPEFCRIFVDIEQSRRDDHAFMRVLDFYGAYDDKNPQPLLSVEGADGIVTALNSLLSFLAEQRATREAAERERRFQVGGA